MAEYDRAFREKYKVGKGLALPLDRDAIDRWMLIIGRNVGLDLENFERTCQPFELNHILKELHEYFGFFFELHKWLIDETGQAWAEGYMNRLQALINGVEQLAYKMRVVFDGSVKGWEDSQRVFTQLIGAR